MKDTIKKPSQIRAYLALAYFAFRAMTRNKSTFAFGFLFPVVFICIFGLIGNSPLKLTVGFPTGSNQNNPVIAAIKHQSFVSADEENQDVLKDKLKQGKISGIIQVEETSITPHKSKVHLITSSSSPQETGALTALIGSVVDKTNLQLTGVTNPPIIISQSEVSARQSRYIDYALPGQIGFSLLSTAIFGTVFGFIYLKKALVLKRMFSTPTRPLTILLAQGTSRLIMAIMQTLLILGIGVLVFKFYLPHGWTTFFELLLISSIGLVAFLGFGYFMAGLANDENSAGPLVNLITLPQFLLSGTFFPTDSLPNWIQPLANNLPLTYFNTAVRKITTEGQNITSTWPYLLGLTLWGLVMYILAAKTFKWE